MHSLLVSILLATFSIWPSPTSAADWRQNCLDQLDPSKGYVIKTAPSLGETAEDKSMNFFEIALSIFGHSTDPVLLDAHVACRVDEQHNETDTKAVICTQMCANTLPFRSLSLQLIIAHFPPLYGRSPTLASEDGHNDAL